MLLAIQKLCNHMMLILGVPGAFSQKDVHSHQTLLELYTFCPHLFCAELLSGQFEGGQSELRLPPKCHVDISSEVTVYEKKKKLQNLPCLVVEL